MKLDPLLLARSRFAGTLVLVGKDGMHLLYSLSRLCGEKIDRMEHMDISESALPSYLDMPRHHHG